MLDTGSESYNQVQYWFYNQCPDNMFYDKLLFFDNLVGCLTKDQTSQVIIPKINENVLNQSR